MKDRKIVKDIDVSKCEHYDKDCFWHCTNPRTHSYLCKNNSNCKFKKLAKKEAQ